MPMIMSLEGPALDARWLGVRRGPRPTASFFGSTLGAGVNIPLTAVGASLIALGGMVFGVWLADNTRHLSRRR